MYSEIAIIIPIKDGLLGNNNTKNLEDEIKELNNIILIKENKLKIIKNEANKYKLENEKLKNENKKLKEDILKLNKVINGTQSLNNNIDNNEITKLKDEIILPIFYFSLQHLSQ